MHSRASIFEWGNRVKSSLFVEKKKNIVTFFKRREEGNRGDKKSLLPSATKGRAIALKFANSYLRQFIFKMETGTRK